MNPEDRGRDGQAPRAPPGGAIPPGGPEEPSTSNWDKPLISSVVVKVTHPPQASGRRRGHQEEPDQEVTNKRPRPPSPSQMERFHVDNPEITEDDLFAARVEGSTRLVAPTTVGPRDYLLHADHQELGRHEPGWAPRVHYITTEEQADKIIEVFETSVSSFIALDTEGGLMGNLVKMGLTPWDYERWPRKAPPYKGNPLQERSFSMAEEFCDSHLAHGLGAPSAVMNYQAVGGNFKKWFFGRGAVMQRAFQDYIGSYHPRKAERSARGSSVRLLQLATLEGDVFVLDMAYLGHRLPEKLYNYLKDPEKCLVLMWSMMDATRWYDTLAADA